MANGRTTTAMGHARFPRAPTHKVYLGTGAPPPATAMVAEYAAKTFGTDYHRARKPGEKFFVVTTGGHASGFASFVDVSADLGCIGLCMKSLRIVSFIVDRRHALATGAVLCDHLAAKAALAGSDYLHMMVSADATSSVSHFGKLGFRALGRTRDYGGKAWYLLVMGIRRSPIRPIPLKRELTDETKAAIRGARGASGASFEPADPDGCNK